MIGEICALLSALLWAVSVIFFRISGLTVSPLGVNLFKNGVSVVLFVATLLVLDIPLFPQAPVGDYALFLISGALGIALSDTLLFAALNRLGAGRMAIINTLYSPFIVFFSVVLLAERLGIHDWIGAGLILGGVLLAALDRQEGSSPLSFQWSGVLLSVCAMATQAIAIVMIKPLLAQYSVVWVTTVRMVAGILLLMVLTAFHRQRNTYWQIFRPTRTWNVLLPATIMGGYASMLIWTAGFKYAKASIASLLNQTNTVLIVIFASLFLREKLTWRRVAALVMATGGSALVILNGG